VLSGSHLTTGLLATVQTHTHTHTHTHIHSDSLGIEWPIKIIIRRQTPAARRRDCPPVVTLCVRTPKPRWRRRLMLRNVSISFARVHFAWKRRAVLNVGTHYNMSIKKLYNSQKYIHMYVCAYVLRITMVLFDSLLTVCILNLQQFSRYAYIIYTNSFLRQQYALPVLLLYYHIICSCAFFSDKLFKSIVTYNIFIFHNTFIMPSFVLPRGSWLKPAVITRNQLLTPPHQLASASIS